MINKKKVIVVSGANFYSGGTLSVMQDCLHFLDEKLSKEYSIIALVGEKEKFSDYKHVKLMEFNTRKSYFHRIYYEYFYYKKLSKTLKPYLWLSINDMTSNVVADRQAVYCHNPTPFSNIRIKDLYLEPSVFFFTLLYKFLYRINIKENNYVIVQQEWLRDAFCKMFKLSSSKVIVAPPVVSYIPPITVPKNTDLKSKKYLFFFPALPRPSKNIETIAKAVIEINKLKKIEYEVKLTIDGSENNYAKLLFKRYGNIKELDFMGLQSRASVFDWYRKVDCLIFPSILETWGMPISEFKPYNKPIIVSNLEYAKETIGNYDKAVFFEPSDYKQLAEKMLRCMENDDNLFDATEAAELKAPFALNWDSLFGILLNDNTDINK